MSPDVNNPGFRAVTLRRAAHRLWRADPRPHRRRRRHHPDRDDFRHAQRQGGDLRLRSRLSPSAARRLPLMISGTITDRSGRTLSGQTPTAFWHSVRHARPFSIGLNCALGASAMREHLAEIAERGGHVRLRLSRTPACPTISASMTRARRRWRRRSASSPRDGLVNIVGGCCGSTPDHIRAIAEAVRRHRAARRLRPSRR